MKVVIISGSKTDENFVEKIGQHLSELEIEFEYFVASAHKEPKKVLKILEDHIELEKIIFITVAGRSNALSGFCAANSEKIVLACPPFKDKLDYMVNINSTLQMPSNTPVLTILDPKNCAIACKRIFDL